MMMAREDGYGVPFSDAIPIDRNWLVGVRGSCGSNSTRGPSCNAALIQMRFRLRTLLILMALLPPLIWIGWGKYQAWKAEQDRRAFIRAAILIYYSSQASAFYLFIARPPPVTAPDTTVEPVNSTEP
jgi:hypothetical protein